jgi:hypothetical protein
MTANDIAALIKLTLAAFDRGEIGIETCSVLVRGLRAQAESQGDLEDVIRIRRQDYEAPANG